MAALALLCFNVWRISSPMGVPPGSRTRRTFRPKERSRCSSNKICVDFPLPSMPSKVIKSPFMSQFLQTRALGGVLDGPAFGFQFIPNGIGSFKIPRFPGGLASFQQRADFGRDFGLPGRTDA